MLQRRRAPPPGRSPGGLLTAPALRSPSATRRPARRGAARHAQRGGRALRLRGAQPGLRAPRRREREAEAAGKVPTLISPPALVLAPPNEGLLTGVGGTARTYEREKPIRWADER